MHKVLIGEMTRLEFASALKQAKGVILVVGSCEQHGYHLPLDTDSIIGMEMAKAIAEKTNCLVMPSINYGQVFSAQNFPGTFGISQETLKKILKELTVHLIDQGAKNVLYFTGHGGNKEAMKEAARDLLIEKGYRNVWYFSPSITPQMKEVLTGKSTKVPHAGELETSVMLHLRGNLVHMDQVQDEFPIWKDEYNFRPVTWDHIVKAGSFGEASCATAEKGKLLHELSIENLAVIINRLLGE